MNDLVAQLVEQMTLNHWVDTESNIRLLDVPKRIIEKSKWLSKDGHVFPVPGNSRCNVILKELGRQCGFKIRLTYHVARHETVSLFDSGEGSPAPSALHVRVVLPISMSAGIACPFLGRNGLL